MELKHYFLVVITCIFSTLNLYAQDPCDNYDVTLHFSAPYTSDNSPITPGSEFCVDFMLDGFVDIATINFIISFDPSVIELVTLPADLVTNPSINGNFELIDVFTDIGYLSFIWLSPTGSGITIGDTQIFKLTFRAIGDPGDCTTLNLVTDPAIGSPPLVGINSTPTEPTFPCELKIIPQQLCIACTSLNIISSSCGTTSNMGSLSFEFCGGIEPYSYTVTELATSTPVASGTNISNQELVIVNGLMSGNYLIEVTDANGTMFQLNDLISNSQIIDFDLGISRAPICPGSKGVIRVDNITGGFGDPANYSISWSNGTFVIDSLNTNEGDYSVTITDESGCEASKSISMYSDTIKLINLQIEASTCGGNDGKISFDIIGGNPGAGDVYNVFYNNQFIGMGSSFNLDASEGENSIFVRDAIGCVTDTLKYYVPALGQLDVDIVAEDILCFGDSTGTVTIMINDTLDFDPQNPTAFNTLLSSPQGDVIRDNMGNIIVGGTNQNGGSIRYANNLYEGTYYITLLSDSGCTLDTFFSISEPPPMSFTKDSINPDCSVDAGSAIINVNGGTIANDYDYSWLHDPSVNNDTASMLLDGSYFVTVSDDNGCSVETSFVLVSGGDLNLDLSVIQEINCDESVLGIAVVTVTSGLTGFSAQWYDENNTLVSVQDTATMLLAGTYTVSVTDDASGCMGEATIVLDKNAEFNFTATLTNPTCYDGCDGVININQPVGGVMPYNYDWADFGPIGPFVPQLCPGFYELTITDGDNCSRDTIFEIVAPPVVSGTVNSTPTLCYESCDGTATAVGSGGTISTGSYSYQWSSGDSGETVTGLCPGIYMVTIFDELLCASEEVLFEVLRPDSLIAQIDPFKTIDLNCSGDDTGMIGIQVSGGTGQYQFEWSDGISIDNCASDLTEGVYSVTVTDENLCTAEVEYSLLPAPPVTGDIFLTEEIQCFGGRTQLCLNNVSGGDTLPIPNYTYSVNFNNRISIDSCFEVIAGDYRIDIFDASGCSFTTDISVEQPDQILVDLGDDRTMTLGDSTTFISTFITGGVEIDTFIWESDLQTMNFECREPDCSSIFIYPSDPSMYTVTVIDENGCESDASLFIDVLKERRVYRPNVFRPSSIAGNERFMIFIGDGTERIEEFTIFDRWGGQVFNLTNVRREDITPDLGWDGTINGDKAENGVYVYLAKIRFDDSDETIVYKGQLTLIR